MRPTTPKSFRLSEDVVKVLDRQPTATDYPVDAIREKQRREEEQKFRESARRIANLSTAEQCVDFAINAQSKVVLEG